MTFYLKPPRGEIALDKLEDLALKRWQFLNILNSNDLDELQNSGHLSESVMDNSSKDRVSHFFLRLAISKMNSYESKRDFIQGEITLFMQRLKETSLKDVNQSLCEVIRHVDEMSNEDQSLSILSESIVHILKHNMLENEESEFQVPFQLVPDLVAKRQVNVQAGFAIIKTGNVPNFLGCVFTKLLKDSLVSLNGRPLPYGDEEDDQRISNLIKRIQNQIVQDQSNLVMTKTKLKAEDIDNESRHFPPCFLRVHQKLKQNHRLSHHARIAYTLFLKEIGLSVEESLKFWSHFYSKASKDQQKCCHSWQENQNKFTYSINHLYGKLGTGKDYSAHGCSTIIGRSSGIHEELTCPYQADQDIEDFISPQKQCLSNLVTRIPSVQGKLKSLSKPSQYFSLHKMEIQ